MTEDLLGVAPKVRNSRPRGRAFLATCAAAFAAFGVASSAEAALAEYRGVNDFGIYGYATQNYKNNPGGAMKNWGINMVREVVVEFDKIPFGTGSIPTPDGKGRLYGLQGLVNDIKTNVGPNTVTILCPFTWDSEEVLAKVPSATPFFETYKSRLNGMAKQFAGQSNVWLEVWNEPYTVDNPNTWLSDMKSLVSSLRSNTGYTGKIVIPAGNYSGNEAPILSHGQALVDYDPFHNIVFDLHAYSNFIQNRSVASIRNRIQTIKNTGLDFIFGEFGPQILGSNNVEDVSNFITAVKQEGITSLAWAWNSQDSNRLHNEDGSLNNTSANANWANQVLAYTQSAPAVPEPTVLALAGVMAMAARRRRAG